MHGQQTLSEPLLPAMPTEAVARTFALMQYRKYRRFCYVDQPWRLATCFWWSAYLGAYGGLVGVAYNNGSVFGLAIRPKPGVLLLTSRVWGGGPPGRGYNPPATPLLSLPP